MLGATDSVPRCPKHSYCPGKYTLLCLQQGASRQQNGWIFSWDAWNFIMKLMAIYGLILYSWLVGSSTRFPCPREFDLFLVRRCGVHTHLKDSKPLMSIHFVLDVFLWFVRCLCFEICLDLVWAKKRKERRKGSMEGQQWHYINTKLKPSTLKSRNFKITNPKATKPWNTTVILNHPKSRGMWLQFQKQNLKTQSHQPINPKTISFKKDRTKAVKPATLKPSTAKPSNRKPWNQKPKKHNQSYRTKTRNINTWNLSRKTINPKAMDPQTFKP